MLTCAETYNSVEPLLKRICCNYITKYGGDFEEYFSVANESYMKAYDKYVPNKGAFSTFLWRVVWNSLLDESRKKTRLKRTMITYNSIAVEDYQDTKQDTFLVLTKGLSKDACKVVELLMDSGDEIAKVLDLKGKPSAFNYIRKCCMDIGWSVRQVTEAFIEIQKFVGR